jgi:hypothetical protein
MPLSTCLAFARDSRRKIGLELWRVMPLAAEWSLNGPRAARLDAIAISD